MTIEAIMSLLEEKLWETKAARRAGNQSGQVGAATSCAVRETAIVECLMILEAAKKDVVAIQPDLFAEAE